MLYRLESELLPVETVSHLRRLECRNSTAVITPYLAKNAKLLICVFCSSLGQQIIFILNQINIHCSTAVRKVFRVTKWRGYKMQL
jgi:hypothetical protein